LAFVNTEDVTVAHV